MYLNNKLNNKYVFKWQIFFFFNRIATNSLYSLTALVLSLSALFISVTVPPILNAMDPQTIEKYPNYLWVYVLHHYSPQCVLAIIGLSFYSKSQPLRKQVLREIGEHFSFVNRFLEKVSAAPIINLNNNNGRLVKAEGDFDKFQDLVAAHNFIWFILFVFIHLISSIHFMKLLL